MSYVEVPCLVRVGEHLFGVEASSFVKDPLVLLENNSVLRESTLSRRDPLRLEGKPLVLKEITPELQKICNFADTSNYEQMYEQSHQ